MIIIQTRGGSFADRIFWGVCRSQAIGFKSERRKISRESLISCLNIQTRRIAFPNLHGSPGPPPDRASRGRGASLPGDALRAISCLIIYQKLRSHHTANPNDYLYLIA